MKQKKLIKAMIPLYILAAMIMLGIGLAGSRSVTALSEAVPMENRVCVIIDPGHGGEDGGASSSSGTLESDLNLQIALRLEDLLHLLGYDTLMIRRTDISVYTSGQTLSQKKVSDLKERVRIINETKNAEDLVELEGTFITNGMSKEGEVTLTAEQAEVVQYAFRDVTPYTEE